MRSPQEPAMWGVAMLVPLKTTKSALPLSQVALQELMFEPGAQRSGLRRPFDTGPRLLKLESELSEWVVVLLSSRLPTVSTLKASPGVPTEPLDGPEFPAATAAATLRSSERASKKRESPEEPSGVPPPPKEALTASAP